MKVSRRRVLQSAALGGGAGAASAGQAPGAALDGLRQVAEAHGIALREERLRVLKPVLERRRRQLQALREFEIDDSVAPTQGTWL